MYAKNLWVLENVPKEKVFVNFIIPQNPHHYQHQQHEREKENLQLQAYANRKDLWVWRLQLPPQPPLLLLLETCRRMRNRSVLYVIICHRWKRKVIPVSFFYCFHFIFWKTYIPPILLKVLRVLLKRTLVQEVLSFTVQKCVL